MSDPVPAVTEAEATGETAATYADIRQVYRVSVVNLSGAISQPSRARCLGCGERCDRSTLMAPSGASRPNCRRWRGSMNSRR